MSFGYSYLGAYNGCLSTCARAHSDSVTQERLNWLLWNLLYHLRLAGKVTHNLVRVTLHVRTSRPRFCISGSVLSIDRPRIVYDSQHCTDMRLMHRSTCVWLCTWARALVLLYTLSSFSFTTRIFYNLSSNVWMDGLPRTDPTLSWACAWPCPYRLMYVCIAQLCGFQNIQFGSYFHSVKT